jgi:hypothetical protein
MSNRSSCRRRTILSSSKPSCWKRYRKFKEIDSGKFSTIERIHHLEELKRAVDFKIQLMNQTGVDEYKTTFKNKGVMAPSKIEYFGISNGHSSSHQPVIIALKRGQDGSFTVL